MLAGHVGVGLAIAARRREVNAAVYVGAALLLDLALWALILLGVEDARIDASFATDHSPIFRFPYSHSLAAAALWALAAGACLLLRRRVWGSAAAVVLAVLSHWALDAIVHTRDLPFAPGHAQGLAFALWRHLPVALAIESLVAVAGVLLYLAAPGRSRANKAGVAAVAGATLAATVLGMLSAVPPPSVQAMATTSLLTLAILIALLAFFDRRRGRQAH